MGRYKVMRFMDKANAHSFSPGLRILKLEHRLKFSGERFRRDLRGHFFSLRG